MAMKKITDEERQKIIDLLQQGASTQEIAEIVDVTTRQVAAIKAHITMATYEDEITPPSNSYSPQVTSLTEDKTEDVVPHSAYPTTLTSPTSFISIPVGYDIHSSERIFWNPHPDTGSSNPHLMVIGESGYGKTYALQCLVTELAQKGISSVIIDYGQGFDLENSPSELIKYGQAEEILVGRNGIGINPLEVQKTDLNGPLNVAVRVSDSFSRIYRIGIQQHALLRDIVLEAFEYKQIYRDDPNSWNKDAPHFSEVEMILDGIIQDRYDPRSRSMQTLKSHISTFFIFNTFRKTGDSLSWSQIVDSKGKVFIIQLQGLEGRTEKVVTEFLLWDLYNYIVRTGANPLRLFCILDEAHNLSFDSGTPVDRLLREARKFGLGLVFASQQPQDFSQVAYANTASKLIFQTLDDGNKVARQVAAKIRNMGNVKDISRLISQLPRGQALFLSMNYGLPVKIENMESRTTHW